MAVAVGGSALSRFRSGEQRAERVSPVAVATVTVVALLAVMALASGAWLALGVVGALFLVGTALLASEDEPLSGRQIASVGVVHLAAGLLLAL